MKKQAQSLSFRALIGIIVGLSVMALAFVIYSNFNQAPNEAISNKAEATPNTYDQLFSAGNAQVCYTAFSKTPAVQLASGINTVCWTPPAIYGKESENSKSVGYVSPSYACPAGQVIGKVKFLQELKDENDEIIVDAIDENGDIIYTYQLAGEVSANSANEINIYDKLAKYIQFVLIVHDYETVSHNAYEFSGIKVKSIECITPPFDLVPMLSISPTTINNTNAARDGTATIKYGYWTRGAINTVCNPGDDREIVHLAILDLLEPGAKPITEELIMPGICGEKQEKIYPFKPSKGGLYAVGVYVDYLNAQYGGIITEANETNNGMRGDIISTIYTHIITLDATTAPIKYADARDTYSEGYNTGFPAECYAGDGGGRAGKYVITPGTNKVTLGGPNGKSLITDKIYGYVADDNTEWHADAFSIYLIPVTDVGNEYYFKYPSKYYIELANDKSYICGWFRDLDNKQNNNAGTNTLRIDVLE